MGRFFVATALSVVVLLQSPPKLYKKPYVSGYSKEEPALMVARNDKEWQPINGLIHDNVEQMIYDWPRMDWQKNVQIVVFGGVHEVEKKSLYSVKVKKLIRIKTEEPNTEALPGSDVNMVIVVAEIVITKLPLNQMPCFPVSQFTRETVNRTQYDINDHTRFVLRPVVVYQLPKIEATKP